MAAPDDDRIAYTLRLTPGELKVTHTALRALRDDFGHDEAELHEVIDQVLEKLPDEPSIRPIEIEGEQPGPDAAA